MGSRGHVRFYGKLIFVPEPSESTKDKNAKTNQNVNREADNDKKTNCCVNEVLLGKEVW